MYEGGCLDLVLQISPQIVDRGGGGANLQHFAAVIYGCPLPAPEEARKGKRVKFFFLLFLAHDGWRFHIFPSSPPPHPFSRFVLWEGRKRMPEHNRQASGGQHAREGEVARWDTGCVMLSPCQM